MSFTAHRRRSAAAVTAGIVALGVVLAACGTAANTGASSSGQGGGSSKPLNIILAPAANGLPVLVAQSQGFFAKHGISVAKIDHQASSALYPALIAHGQYDIADLTPPTLLTSVSQHLDDIAIANEFNVSKDFPLEYLMVPNGSPIKTLQDLNGKKVGTASITGNLWISFQNALKKAGMDPSSVNPLQVPFPNMADTMAAHRVDAVLAIAPFSDAIKAKGNKSIDEPYLSIGPNVVGQVFAANRTWAQSHKPEVKNFIAALKDATAYMKDHPDVAAEQLSKFTGVSLGTAKNTLLPPFSYDLQPQMIGLWKQTMEYVAPNPNIAKLDPKSLVLDLSS